MHLLPKNLCQKFFSKMHLRQDRTDETRCSSASPVLRREVNHYEVLVRGKFFFNNSAYETSRKTSTLPTSKIRNPELVRHLAHSITRSRANTFKAWRKRMVCPHATLNKLRGFKYTFTCQEQAPRHLCRRIFVKGVSIMQSNSILAKPSYSPMKKYFTLTQYSNRRNVRCDTYGEMHSMIREGDLRTSCLHRKKK